MREIGRENGTESCLRIVKSRAADAAQVTKAATCWNGACRRPVCVIELQRWHQAVMKHACDMFEIRVILRMMHLAGMLWQLGNWGREFR